MKTFLISLKNLRFFSKIGVFEQERIIGNEFIVNVSIEIAADGFVSESLDTTVSYAEIYDIVKADMNVEWLLLESVAEKILEDIRAKVPYAFSIEVIIDKLAPPIPGIQGNASVKVSWR